MVKTGGIGDYIHYRKIMYKQFGIGVREPGISASAALSEQRKKLQINTGAAFPTNFKIELEKTLTSLMYPNQKENQNYKIIDAEKQEQIRQEMERLAQVYDPKIVADWERGGELPGTEKGGTISKLGERNGEKNKDYVRVSTVYNRIQEFFAILKQQKNKKVMSIDDAKRLKKEMSTIEKELKKQLSNFSEDSRLIIRTNSSLWSYIDQINGLIQQLKYPKLKLLGDMWEDAVAKVSSAVGKWADEQAENLVQTTITKTADKRKNLNFNNVVGKYVNTSILSTTYDLSENTKGELVLSTGEKVCKADISLEFYNKTTKETNNIGLSAKNYFGDNIHIVDKTPLMDLLLDASSSFANHTLNMMTQNETGGYSVLDIGYQKELKRICAVKALQGATNSKNYSADYMILNDRKNKCVVLKSISEIMNKVNGDVDKYFTFIPSLDSIKLTNNFVETTSGNNMLAARERIANVLIAARAVKISASMKKSALY